MNVMTYLGKPWQNGAAGPHAFDCWGLVRSIYAQERGVTVPAVDVDALKPLAVRHAFESHAEYSKWQPVAHPYADFDVVLLSQASRPHHVGVWFGGRLLHSVEGTGVIWQDVSSLKAHAWNLVAGYRRR